MGEIWRIRRIFYGGFRPKCDRDIGHQKNEINDFAGLNNLLYILNYIGEINNSEENKRILHKNL